MDTMAAIDNLSKELREHRERARPIVRNRVWPLPEEEVSPRTLAEHHCHDMRRIYDDLVNAKDPTDLLIRLWRTSAFDPHNFFSTIPISVRENAHVLTIMGHSMQELFDRRAPIALEMFRQFAYQEQLIEQGKIVEASLNGPDVLGAIADSFR